MKKIIFIITMILVVVGIVMFKELVIRIRQFMIEEEEF